MARSSLIAWVALAATVTIWASFLVSTRAAVASPLGPIEVGLMRFGPAALLFLPVYLREGLLPGGARPRDALLIAGTIAAQATSLSQLFGAPSADPSSAIGTTLHMAGLALLMAGGFHLALIEMLAESWRVFPVGFVMPGGDLAQWGTARVADAFTLAVTLSIPFVIVSVL